MTADPAAGSISGHIARFRSSDAGPDGRLSSLSAERNGPPLIAALSPWIGARQGPVVEIGCGTGQHGASFELAFPGIAWWASDPDPAHRASAGAWRAHLRLPPRPALALDAAADWAPGVAHLGPCEAVYSSNVIHIAPREVMRGIVSGAPRVLAKGGLLIFYGPFVEGGRHTGSGNVAFDAGLRAEDPSWGLRDLDDLRRLAEGEGLALAAIVAMPANNRLVLFRKP